MNRLPLILRLSIPLRNGVLRLWLPFFLIYPFLAVFVLIILPLVIIAALLLWPFGWSRKVILLGPYLFRVICALRGLEINIQQRNKQILVYFK